MPFDLPVPVEVFGRTRVADGTAPYRVRVCAPTPHVDAGSFAVRVQFGLEAAYADLADALEAAVEDLRDAAPADRVRAFAAVYRTWATSQPHRYRLLFGAPIPGFAAHSERLIAAAQRSMDTLLAILVDLDPTSDTGTQRPVNLDSQLRAWASRVGASGVAQPAQWRAVLTWSRLHGAISLEIGGNFESMGIDATRLYEAEIDALLKGP